MNSGQFKLGTVPALYDAPEPVSAAAHGKLKLAPGKDFRFAGEVNALPIAAVEFVAAARSFPILFDARPPFAPIAILGLRNKQNLFVESSGQWQEGAYIPAYVRRYPFLFLEDHARQKNVLAIERTCTRFNLSDGDPLFEGEEASPFLNQAIGFCEDYARQWSATLHFTAALKEMDLLTPVDEELKLANGRVIQLKDLTRINERRLNDVPAETFIDWRTKGLLPPVYAQIASQHTWVNLAVSEQRRAEELSREPADA